MTSHINYPGSTHVILKELLQQLGWNYYYIYLLSGFLISLLFAYCFISSKPNRIVVFYVLTTLLVVFYRISTLVMYSHDPDESQFITAINALLNDSRYWKSADMYTSGPLNIMPLVLLYKTGIPLNYFSLRSIMILFIQLPTLFFLCKTFSIIAGRKIATLSIFPIILFYAFLNHQELISFNSEQIPNLFSALALYFIVSNYYTDKANEFRLGFVLSCMMFTKLQYAPIAAFLGITALLLFYKKKISGKRLLAFLRGGVLPILLVLIYLLITNTWNDFLISYVFVNIVISKQGLINSVPFPESIYNVPKLICTSPEFLYLSSITLILICLSAIVLFKMGKNFKISTLPIFFGCLYILITYWCIIQNGNKFLHYIFLLLIPISLVIFWAVRIINEYKFLTTLFVLICIMFLTTKNYLYRYFMYDIIETPLIPYTSLAEYINKIDSRNEKIAVWGWNTSIYVETENIQATRDPHSYNQILETPYQPYFINRYVEDLKKNTPRIFIDGVPDLFFTNAEKRINHYPLISAYIYEHYTLIDSLNTNRIFIRKNPQ